MATNDNIRRTTDHIPVDDAQTEAGLGGLSNMIVGSVGGSGSVAGPVGTVVGVAAGAVLGTGATRATTGEVGRADNDNTVSGVIRGDTTQSPDAVKGYGASTVRASGGVPDVHAPNEASNLYASSDAPVTGTGLDGRTVAAGQDVIADAGGAGLAGGALLGGTLGAALGGPVGAILGGTFGSLAGGAAEDARESAEDNAAINEGSATYAATTRPGVSPGEVTPVSYVSGATGLNNAGQGYAAANNFEGDAFRASAGMGSNFNTGISDTRDMYHGTTSVGGADLNADTPDVGGFGTEPVAGVRMGGGNEIPGAPLGGGTPQDNTHGLFVKGADALTGDHIDDITGGPALNQTR